ncbi:hypothetical protein [Shewanella sp. SNU WT4]|uniref:hypothetical protein n=1 Tax=Shewanella sp. SNU WT4 TaxID=2590015 RepID=UPI00143D8595|nr:hypothetical protein [Shewanella sp. SNU WT4]
MSMIDNSKYQILAVHLREKPSLVAKAQTQGVNLVPALVVDGKVLHINVSAPIFALA